MLEGSRSKAPGLALNEPLDVAGAQNAEIHVLASEMMDEEVTNVSPVATYRADGKTAIPQQKLLEAGDESIGGQAVRTLGVTELVLAQVAK